MFCSVLIIEVKIGQEGRPGVGHGFDIPDDYGAYNSFKSINTQLDGG